MRRVSHSTSAVDRLGLIAVAALDALCYPLILAGASSAPHLTFAALRALIDITPERIAPAVTSLAQADNRPKKTDPSGAPDKPIWRLASGQIRQYRSA